MQNCLEIYVVLVFSLPYSSSHHYPSMMGALPLQGLFLSWPMLQSSQSLCRRLSIIDDIVISCSVAVVELCSGISDPSNHKAYLFGLHSLSLSSRFDSKAFTNETLHN